MCYVNVGRSGNTPGPMMKYKHKLEYKYKYKFRVEDVVGSAWSLILLVSVDAATLLLSGLILFRCNTKSILGGILNLYSNNRSLGDCWA